MLKVRSPSVPSSLGGTKLIDSRTSLKQSELVLRNLQAWLTTPQLRLPLAKCRVLVKSRQELGISLLAARKKLRNGFTEQYERYIVSHKINYSRYLQERLIRCLPSQSIKERESYTKAPWQSFVSWNSHANTTAREA